MSTIPTHHLQPTEHPTVLVTSGAFCPVHRNHLLYMEAARAFLERPEPGHQVVGGYISALPDRMVARRRGGAISRAHRTAMLQLAAADSFWLMVVEADLHGRALFSAVARQASEALGGPVAVVAVCGADGYRASDRFLPPDIPLACVRRTGEDAEWKALWRAPSPARRLYLVEDNLQPQPRSATQVRAWLQRARGDDAEALALLQSHLHPAVLRYLLDHPEAHA